MILAAGCGAPTPTPSAIPPSTSASIRASGPPATPVGSRLVETDPLPIEIVESGFTAAPDQDGSASYGAILRNPNTSWAAVRMEVLVDFLDEGGGFLVGQDVVATILPGQTTAIGGRATGAGSAASMEVAPPDDIVAFQPRQAADGTFEVTEVETTSAGDQTITTGRIWSSFQDEQTFVELVAIYRDGAGAIVGGAGGGVASVPPGSSVTFEIIETSPAAEIAATEVYWQVTR